MLFSLVVIVIIFIIVVIVVVVNVIIISVVLFSVCFQAVVIVKVRESFDLKLEAARCKPLFDFL